MSDLWKAHTPINYSLYLCTDRKLMSSNGFEESLRAALRGGVTLVQLREKDCTDREFYELACQVQMIANQHHVYLIINDRVDIARAVGADGIHLGQDDLPCRVVRQQLGDYYTIGVTVHNLAEAIQAEADGADYIGVGAVFPTKTKQDAVVIAPEELIAIRKAVSIPMVAIGGINKENLSELKGKGLDGIAVISAILAQPDVEAAAREMRTLWGDGTLPEIKE